MSDQVAAGRAQAGGQVGWTALDMGDEKWGVETPPKNSKAKKPSLSPKNSKVNETNSYHQKRNKMLLSLTKSYVVKMDLTCYTNGIANPTIY